MTLAVWGDYFFFVGSLKSRKRRITNPIATPVIASHVPMFCISGGGHKERIGNFGRLASATPVIFTINAMS